MSIVKKPLIALAAVIIAATVGSTPANASLKPGTNNPFSLPAPETNFPTEPLPVCFYIFGGYSICF
jgi:hypothetical protein